MRRISELARFRFAMKKSALALSFPLAVLIFAPLPATSQQPSSGASKSHSNHNPQHGGIFFMALDNKHHLEGVLLEPGVFKVYLYDAFTKPLSAVKTKQAIGDVQIGSSESAPKVLLTVGKNGDTLESDLSKGLKLPVTITLSLRFRDVNPDASPEVFTFPFSHFIAANARPQAPSEMDHSGSDMRGMKMDH